MILQSSDSTKTERTLGHLFGTVSVLAGHEENYSAIPMVSTIQNGLAELANWAEDKAEKGLTHVVQMTALGYNVARHFVGPYYFVLNSYFLTVSVLTLLNALNNGDRILDIITHAKKNCRAFEKPVPNEKNGEV